jgi:hypothetical protein
MGCFGFGKSPLESHLFVLVSQLILMESCKKPKQTPPETPPAPEARRHQRQRKRKNRRK